MNPAELPFDADAMLEGLRTWIECESPTYDAASVNRMQKQERMSPRARGRSQRSFCSGVATCSSRWMFASSGAKMCIATGPSSE